jgi:hypothetical protein
MKRNIVTTSLLLAVACIGLVAYAGYESEHRSEKTEENPKCTSRNVGSSCQRRVCFRVTCFTGESSCTPTNWDCGPWETGTCKRRLLGLDAYCAID